MIYVVTEDKKLASTGKEEPKDAKKTEPASESEEKIKKLAEKQKQLEEQLKAKDKKISDLESDLKWSRADFDNFRKSTEKHMDADREAMQAKLLKDFLPFFDTFDKAMRAASDIQQKSPDLNNGLKQFFGGLEGLYKNLNAILDAKKLKRIDALGKKFDYNYHEVSLQIEDEQLDEDTVVQEIQKGWLLNGKVLRPAMVAVSKKPVKKTPEPVPEEREFEEDEPKTEKKGSSTQPPDSPDSESSFDD